MQTLQGIAVSPGVAIGEALVMDHEGFRIPRRFVARDAVEHELARLESAINAAAAEIARIDLDEESVMRNLAYYQTLRALDDPRAAINAIGAHGGFTVGKRRHAP